MSKLWIWMPLVVGLGAQYVAAVSRDSAVRCAPRSGAAMLTLETPVPLFSNDEGLTIEIDGCLQTGEDRLTMLTKNLRNGEPLPLLDAEITEPELLVIIRCLSN